MSFIDLTNSWHYKDLVRWQYMHAHALNDQVTWFSRGLIYYDDFESYIKSIKYGIMPDWDKNGTLDAPATIINNEVHKFGGGSLYISAETECLLNAGNKDNSREGSISFWLKGANKNKKLWTTQWGMSIYIDTIGHLCFSIKDSTNTEYKVVWPEDISGDDWSHVVAVWRCKGDGLDLMTLYYNGVKA